VIAGRLRSVRGVGVGRDRRAVRSVSVMDRTGVHARRLDQRAGQPYAPEGD
jgi:hypothetical protein